MGRRRVPKTGTTTASIAPSKRRTETDQLLRNGSKRVKAQAGPSSRKPRTRPHSIVNSVPTRRLQVYTFGTGSAGELVLGSSKRSAYRPTLNDALDVDSVGVVSLAAGGMHAAALTYDSKIFTWGCNDKFALGRDTTYATKMASIDASNSDAASDSGSEAAPLNPLEATPTPIPSTCFPPGTKFTQLAAGDNATFALTDDGQVYGWGSFRDSQGNHGFSIDSAGRLIEVQKSPRLIPDLTSITQLSAGVDYALALDQDGMVYSWGFNDRYQLGRRSLSRHRSLPLLPKLVALPKRQIVLISAGNYHAFAIDKSGNVWAWGANSFCQTGIPTGVGGFDAIVMPPEKVDSFGKSQIRSVQGGNDHSVAVTTTGECLGWGKVHDGRTGAKIKSIPLDDPSILVEYNKPSTLLTPTPLAVSHCVFIAAGDNHSVMVTSNGQAYSWGLNNDGQCGMGPGAEEEILIPNLVHCYSGKTPLLGRCRRPIFDPGERNFYRVPLLSKT